MATILEKFWSPTIRQSPISVANSIITVTSTSGIHPKQIADLYDTFGNTLQVLVTRVLNSTQFTVAPMTGETSLNFDALLPAYNGGSVIVVEQERNGIEYQWCLRSAFLEEPAVAFRNVLVDQFGDYYATVTDGLGQRRLAVDAQVSVIAPTLSVRMTSQDNVPNPGDVHDSIRIGDQFYEMSVNSDHSINVHIKDASGNAITSQANGSQRALDVGIDVAGVQVDPRQIRALTASDVVTTTRSTCSVVNTFRNDYTVNNATTSAYLQVLASTSAAIRKLEIFDSSGQTLWLAIGASGSEVNLLYIIPGGNGQLDIDIPTGTRLSVKAVSALANQGEITVNCYSAA